MGTGHIRRITSILKKTDEKLWGHIEKKMYCMVHKNKRGGQSEKQMMENFSLDIFCQESIIGNIKKILFTEIR